MTVTVKCHGIVRIAFFLALAHFLVSRLFKVKVGTPKGLLKQLESICADLKAYDSENSHLVEHCKVTEAVTAKALLLQRTGDILEAAKKVQDVKLLALNICLCKTGEDCFHTGMTVKCESKTVRHLRKWLTEWRRNYEPKLRGYDFLYQDALYTFSSNYPYRNPGNGSLLCHSACLNCGIGQRLEHYQACLVYALKHDMAPYLGGALSSFATGVRTFEPVLGGWISTDLMERPDLIMMPDQIMRHKEFADELPLIGHDHFPKDLAWLPHHEHLWYFSAMGRYLMQIKDDVQDKLDERLASFGLEQDGIKDECFPGVLITESDLRNETSLPKFMVLLHEVFEQCDSESGETVARKFLLVTDVPGLSDEIKKSYPDLEVVGGIAPNKTYGTEDNTPESEEVPNIAFQEVLEDNLIGLTGYETSVQEFVINLMVLVHCDFVLCNMSYSLCRLVHQFRGGVFVDSEQRIFSVERDTWEHYEQGREPPSNPNIFPMNMMTDAQADQSMLKCSKSANRGNDTEVQWLDYKGHLLQVLDYKYKYKEYREFIYGVDDVVVIEDISESVKNS